MQQIPGALSSDNESLLVGQLALVTIPGASTALRPGYLVNHLLVLPWVPPQTWRQ